MKNHFICGLIACMVIFTACQKGDPLNPIKFEPGPGVAVAPVPHDSTYYVYPKGYTEENAFLKPLHLGVPAYLTPTKDIIDANFIPALKSTLVTAVSLTKSHPELLKTSAVNIINVTATSDMYVTFLLTKGGYKNSIAYYIFKTANPPKTTFGGSDHGAMDTITYIFPNTLSMKAGDKFKIGTLAAGMSIGFVLLYNSWNGSSIDTKGIKYYSQDTLNAEKPSLKRHSILFYDKSKDLYIVAFERASREFSDSDFCDEIFYVTSNKKNSIASANIALFNSGEN
ncbi:DUF4114 domain-containing protein [Mucilaginibacter agri]|uniref:DUF4114 domain-containing protein n=1 Tax=Mucilaginibacter agri TaxID=2695265 RepID=A0A965ZEP5_9SPHI|nr:DUF4114 domain-containing protein [Mucilaginibacter agri]NCD68402.1 DUF4114 domain-containing protein [Mucilaginibacter agri]